jgi:hypothetical protein
MALPSVADIIDIARLSQVYAANDIAKKGVYGGGIDRRLPQMLYIERKAVEAVYALDPTDDYLRFTANYLYALCGPYGLRAAYALDSGSSGTVAPATPPTGFTFVYLIPITGPDFADATNYNDPRIVGKDLEIFWDNVNRYLLPTEFNPTPIGIEILIDGFDATSTNSDAIFKIYIENPTGTSGSGVSGVYNFSLLAITAFSNLAAGTDGQIVTYNIIPNGFAYTWGTIFAFSDNMPEQPGATVVGTQSTYSFRYSLSLARWICVEQSLNIPI